MPGSHRIVTTLKPPPEPDSPDRVSRWVVVRGFLVVAKCSITALVVATIEWFSMNEFSDSIARRPVTIVPVPDEGVFAEEPKRLVRFMNGLGRGTVRRLPGIRSRRVY